MVIYFSSSGCGLLMLPPQLSAAFCHLRLHHQPFVRVQVPPTDGSVMRLQHEKQAINKDDEHVSTAAAGAAALRNTLALTLNS